jgi:hypothetical protein
MNDSGETPPEDASPWWPAKWMFLTVAVTFTVGADPSRDRENWGIISVLAVSVPVVVLLGRDLFSVARGSWPQFSVVGHRCRSGLRGGRLPLRLVVVTLLPVSIERGGQAARLR